MCSADKCTKYGRSWACPPAVGSLENISKRAAAYSGGIVVQTVEVMDDEFDLETIRRCEAKHKSRFDTIVRQAKRIYGDILPMGAGGCTRCKKCTYPSKPCRFPGKVFPSMEAYGLLVGDVCLKNGLKYNYGVKTMTFTACILVK